MKPEEEEKKAEEALRSARAYEARPGRRDDGARRLRVLTVLP